jgi:hypothetical protein
MIYMNEYSSESRLSGFLERAETAIRRNAEGATLLFDEIEKAHLQLIDIFFSLLEEWDLIFWKLAKARFSAWRFVLLYRGWKTGRIFETQVREEFQSNGTHHAVRFEPRLLKGVGPARGEGEEQR